MQQPETRDPRDLIAVVGYAGRFPGAPDVRAYWRNLVEGVESVRELTREEMIASGVSPDALDHPAYVAAGVPLEDADLFDAAFFGVNPREAELMDPQHRIFLECAFAALEDAGYDPDRYAGPIGVFGGVARNTYFIHQFPAYQSLIEAGGLYEAMLGFDKDYVATRVSYKLNLRGPAFDVQTACSTSGVAFHLACQSLFAGECDMALAGGARIRVPLRGGYMYVEGGVPSPDGHCRAFDADAAGCVFGSGAAILVLKRLDEALRDGDAIRAVVRATAINNDGSAKVGFTAPSMQGQAAVIEEALGLAGVTADAIGYVETHGTGTTLGDPIEVGALTRAFRKTTEATGYCPIGSVKTNIGHLDAGAAAAGLLKTVLSLEHGAIPASLNFRSPNPQIDFENSPFFVNAELRPWPRGERPRLAGVSSFGLGGTNFHAVLEEPPAPAPAAPSRPRQLLLLSAKTATALDARAADLAGHLEADTDGSLADVAYTLQVGRKQLEHRRALVAADREDAVSLLRSGDPRRVLSAADVTGGRPVVFMFPGGGAQYPNMGLELYRHEPVFRAHVDECLRLVEGQLDVPLRDYLYPGDDVSAGVAEALERPSLALPALFITEYALARLWQSWGIQPAALIGHSMGEYTAACISGVMTLRDALALTVLRGKLFERLSDGGMMSVPLSEEEVRPLMVDGLSIAAVNTPGHCVLSGPRTAVDRMGEVLDGRGVDYTALHISVAAHSAMVEPLLEELGDFLRTLRFEPPRIPFVSNVTGTWITPEEAMSPEHWVTHLRQTVRFSDGIGVLFEDPSLAFLEVGPGQTLSVFARQHPAKAATQLVAPSIRHPKERVSDVEFLLGTLGRLWLAGVDVDWRGFYRDEDRRRVSLPTYPYERKRYWLDAHRSGGGAVTRPPVAAPGVAAAPAPTAPESRQHGVIRVEAAAASAGAAPAKAPPAAEPVDRKARITGILKQILHEMSGVAAEGLDPHATFLQLGFDSLFLTRANIEFQKRFGVRVTFRQLFDEAPTLDALAGFIEPRLADDFFAEEEAAEAAAAAAPTPAAGSAPALPIAGTTDALAAHPAPSGLSTTAPGEGGVVERVIAQQLRVMQEQLAMLRGGASSPASTAPEPVASAPGAPAGAPSSSAPTAAPAPAAAPARRVPAPVTQTSESSWRSHGPWRPISGAVDGLSDHQRAHLNALVERYTRRTAGSKALTAGQRERLSDPRAITGFHRSWKEMVYQIAMVESSGARMVDVDGNEYVDVTMGFGINLFGHSPEFVKEAVRRQLDRGLELGALTPLARDVAERLCEITGMERATLVNTGSEAVAAAVRAARTVTARDRIAVFNGDYHGIAEELLVAGVDAGGERKAYPVAPGIPASVVQNVLVLDYEDPRCLDILREEADSLAAVIVEPVPSRRPDFQPKELLKAIRELTAEHGIAFIFDEMMTGFRLHPRGAQGMYGITADIAAYGKILSGGLPMAAVAGKAEYLDAFDGGAWSFGDDSFPEARVTFFGGTFVRHPLSMAASRAVLDRLRSDGPALQDGLNQRATELAGRLNAGFRKAGVPLRMANCGSMLHLGFEDDNPLARLIFFYLREKGIHIWDRPAFLSTAHTPEDVDSIVAAFESAVAGMQEAGFLPPPPSPSGGDRTAPAATPEREEAPAPTGGRTPVRATAAANGGRSRPAADRDVPLTAAQQEIWLATRFSDEASRAYHLSLSIDLTGALDPEALAAAVQAAVGRHEALRTTIGREGDVQHIAGSLEVELPVEDLTRLESDAAEERIRDLLAGEMDRPFDLEAGPLVRFRLARLAPDRNRLLLVAHHIICDAVSLRVVARDLGELYRRARGDETVTLPEAIPFGDYAEIQARERDSEEGKAAEAYWVGQYAGSVPTCELPTDRPRPPIKTYAAAQERVRLPASVYPALKRMATGLGCTPFTALLAVCKVFLHRLTSEADLAVGIASAGQSRVGHDLVGHCVNTLPIRSRPRGDVTFAAYLRELREKVLDAFDHGGFTYGALLPKLKLRRDASRAPLLSVMFNLDPQVRKVSFGDLEAEVSFNPKRFENFDLFLNAVETGDDLALEFSYNTDLFDAATMRAWLGHVATLAAAVAEDPDRPIATLPLLAADERRRVLVEWNDTDAPYPAEACIHQLVEAQARTSPEAIAVTDGERALTYAELEARANRLARHLGELGVGADAPVVGVCLDRSADMVVAVLGILKAGGAYLPLDPDFPAERLRFMVADAGVRIIVSQESLLEALPESAAGVLCIDRDAASIDAASAEPPALALDPEGLAYLIYTSGSTGKPKGVEVPHRSVVNFLTTMAREPGLGPDDVLLAVTTLSFDISVLELLLPLAVGGTVVVASRSEAGDARALMERLELSGATAMQATPATWRLLLDAGWPGSPGLKVLCGGEALPRELADRLLDRVAELWNMYGPTETTVWSACGRVTPGEGPVLLGRPIGNTRLYILDGNGQPVPVGAPGELHIGGAGVARGYWNRPELTAERFVPDPFCGEAGARMYRTGDLVRYRADGRLEYLGRMDHQVKVRGFRIELGEIETVLAEHPAVTAAVATVREDRPGDVRLAAYLVVRQGETFTTTDLRRHLRARLPEYMVPQHFVELDELPLTPNGKIDRKALPEPVAHAGGGANGRVAPRSEREKLIASIWADVLGTESVGVHDNFFDLGGHSLLSMQVISRIEQATGERLNPRAMILHTLEQIASETEAGLVGSGPEPETAVSSPGFARRVVDSVKKTFSSS